MAEAPTFAFGRNWQRFLRCVTDARLASAEASLREFMQVGDLRGRSMVDIGCGSGLFSAAAWRLGARPLVSFDVDPFSVECGRHFHRLAGEPPDWRVLQGSILDEPFVRSLGRFDVVYSWGVLHHTGDMWRAVARAAEMVNPCGLFYIALYNAKRGARGSRYWLRIKRAYNRAPAIGKRLMEQLYFAYYIQSKLIRLKNPLAAMRAYESKRGMNWKTDLIDWLGGYPYEFATVEEVFKFVRDRRLGFQLVNLATTDGLGCNSFLFRRE